MTSRDPERNPKAFLGEELRRARVAAGYSSQEALAAKLGFERTVITKAETGYRPPTPDVLSAWCVACGLDEDFYGRLTRMARSADGPIPTWFQDWLEAEGQAHTLRQWSAVMLPGLLQTAEYARALFLAAQLDTSDDAIDALVAARLERRAILDRADPPHMVAVLYEAVLHHLVGSAQVMYEALAFIVELSQRPNVSVQVIPVDAGANAGLGGSFCLASSDGAPEVLVMETVEDVTTETRTHIRKAENIFVRVQADALPRAASRTLIQETAEQWKTR